MSLLDSRLEAVLQLIPAGSVLLDVGTDHCKLPAEAVRQGKAKKAYASDVKEGPLEAAKRQLTALGLEEKVELFLSDGLRQIPEAVLEEVTAVSVAGMGGEVMEVILKTAPKEPPLWVLQPMSAIYELLDFMAAQGYEITAAALRRDGEKFYRIFAVRKTGAPYPPDPFRMHRGDPLYLPFLEKEEQRYQTALQGLLAAKTPNEGRIAAVEEMLKKIRKAKLA